MSFHLNYFYSSVCHSSSPSSTPKSKNKSNHFTSLNNFTSLISTSKSSLLKENIQPPQQGVQSPISCGLSLLPLSYLLPCNHRSHRHSGHLGSSCPAMAWHLLYLLLRMCIQSTSNSLAWKTHSISLKPTQMSHGKCITFAQDQSLQKIDL